MISIRHFYETKIHSKYNFLQMENLKEILRFKFFSFDINNY